MAEWRYYRSATGRDLVHEEIKGCQLDDPELATLEAVMNRVAEGRANPGEVDNLGNGILEIRIRGQNRIFRLLFARVTGGDLVLLALHFFNKKTQKTPPAKIGLARRRLRAWDGP